MILVVLLSCTTQLNVGLVAIAIAWLIGLLAGIDANQVMAGFPSNLFLTLLGVTFLFAHAEVNGTLARVATSVLRLARGNSAAVVILFFLFSAAISTLGAGAVPTVALAAPLAMGAASRSRIPAFLMAVMIGNGANAGNLSPISPVGVIAAKILERSGLGGHAWHVYLNHLIAHMIISAIILAILGGTRIWRESTPDATPAEMLPWQRPHFLTLGLICSLLAGVLFFQLPVGLAALSAGVLLTVFRTSKESEVIARMPWGVIIMVCGMSVLVAMLERTGGLDLFSSWIARASTPSTITAVVAFVSGIVSAYSSTSGVVLPAFLPMVPNLVQQIGGGDPIAIVSSINLGSHLVDVSPLSTIGAMCIAAAGAEVDRHKLFRQLMLWGLSMSMVGALASFLLFGTHLL